MSDLQKLLELSAARHSHLCPRQVLGVRIGLAGGRALDLALPRRDKRLLVILETDGCFADGVEVATGTSVGRRTLKVADYGKIAATFIDVKSETAVRIAPQLDVRDRAWTYAPEEQRRYFAQLVGYQQIPDAELLTIQTVTLTTTVAQIVSRPGVRVDCAVCGEEIINEREIWLHNRPLCQACAGSAYYVCPEGSEQLTVNSQKSKVKSLSMATVDS
jgi:formylmethanofuran dehydrogenase subunit E